MCYNNIYDAPPVVMDRNIQCGRILCEFEIVRYRNINNVSLYAQSLK
jgi:hypothetical protein